MGVDSTKIPPATELISAREARQLAAQAKPGRAYAEADALSAHALRWAMHNAEGQTSSRIRTYARYGKTSITLKFAPGESDGGGVGNAFYNDLLANSNVVVADAIADIINGREQDVISPLQQMRLLNAYNAKLVAFIRKLRRLGYDVRAGEELAAAQEDAGSQVCSKSRPAIGPDVIEESRLATGRQPTVNPKTAAEQNSKAEPKPTNGQNSKAEPKPTNGQNSEAKSKLPNSHDESTIEVSWAASK